MSGQEHRRAAAVVATGAEVLVTATPGCLMQIASTMRRSGRAVALAHTAEILDASIRGVPIRRASRSQGE
jgi:glycolate oxidase iron-sulfur subunit